MKKFLKKNQLATLIIALMLITAGYLNYNSINSVETATEIASIGDATLVNANILETNNEINSIETNTNSIQTNTNLNNEINENLNYFANSKLERETMYAEMLESYQKILDGQNVSEAQKEAAQIEITKINNAKNGIMISENLIKTKGFNDCIIFVNENSVNVVVDKEDLSKEETAQIQNIIAREMNAKLEDIHIMSK